MQRKKVIELNPEACSLVQLCQMVKDYIVPFEDVAEAIENKSYAICLSGNSPEAFNELIDLAGFFERMPQKNEENCRDLADIYILIGEIHQYFQDFQESVLWFTKAAVVSDRYAMPYHNLATSFVELGDITSAVRSLEQEIALEPGNYFSILRLVDLHEQQGHYDKAEECLKQILERNPDNIKALHKLITYYEDKHPDVDVELMRRRLLSINKNFNEIETVIRTYHLCKEKRFADAINFIAVMIEMTPTATMFYLLKAHVFDEMRQFARKKMELAEFRKSCFGKRKFMENKLEEFAHIFGKGAVAHLGKSLLISHAQQ